MTTFRKFISSGLGFKLKSSGRKNSLRRVLSGGDPSTLSDDFAALVQEKSIREIVPALEAKAELPDLPAVASRLSTTSLDLQLELIRQGLRLTTVALLWPNREGTELRLLSFASLEESDLNPGPYPLGGGIVAALVKGKEMVAVAPVGKEFGGIPYHRRGAEVGGFLALTIGREPSSEGAPGRETIAFLCVDRQAKTPWLNAEIEFLKLAGQKLGLELELSRRFHTVGYEHDLIQRICIGFQELNRGLGLESVYTASLKAVAALVDSDLVAISLLRDDCHYVAAIASPEYDHLRGREFRFQEGLVGQVMKFNNTLPANGQYSGPAPVFGNDELLSGFSSLLILPLRTEEGRPMGALTVAAKGAGRYTKQRHDSLTLIARQIAIKIDLALSHEQIRKMATTDGLTNLANHRTFQRAFDAMLHRAQRQQTPLSLIFCDLDLFKRLNDNYGHLYGDQVLKAVAKVLLAAVRQEDVAARYGGEEFAIVLENSDRQGAYRMAERIRKDIEALPFRVKDTAVKVTLSLGIASYPADGEQKNLLIDRADQALYQAKNAGRNQTVAWRNGGELLR